MFQSKDKNSYMFPFDLNQLASIWVEGVWWGGRRALGDIGDLTKQVICCSQTAGQKISACHSNIGRTQTQIPRF